MLKRLAAWRRCCSLSFPLTRSPSPGIVLWQIWIVIRLPRRHVRHWYGGGNCYRIRDRILLSALCRMGPWRSVSDLSSVAGGLRGRRCLQPVDGRVGRRACRVWSLWAAGSSAWYNPATGRYGDRRVCTACMAAAPLRAPTIPGLADMARPPRGTTHTHNGEVRWPPLTASGRRQVTSRPRTEP
jgi:hypothetical protein